MGEFVQTPAFAAILSAAIILALLVGLFLNPVFRKKVRAWWREPEPDPFEHRPVSGGTSNRRAPEARPHGTAGPRPRPARVEKKAAPGHRSG